MNRDDRKELVNRPAVRQGLKHREITIIGVRKILLEIDQIIRDVVELFSHTHDLLAGRPVEVFDARPGGEVDHAGRKQRLSLVLQGDRVVVGLLIGLGVDRLIGIEHRMHRAVLLGGRLEVIAHARTRHLVDTQDVEHEDGVVGHQGPTGFGDDVRVRDTGLVASIEDAVDDVGGVLLMGVVHRRVEVGLAAVVVHGETATDVHVVEAGGAHLAQVVVDADGLADGFLHRTDGRDLAADVKVQQLQAIEHVVGFEDFDGSHDLRSRQAKLAAVTRGFLPLACPTRRQTEANADVGAEPLFLGHLQDQVQLSETVEHQERRQAQALSGKGRGDVFAVFVAIADEQTVFVFEQCRRNEEFGFAASLKSQVGLLAGAHKFFDHMALLVDLDGHDAAVLALVAVLIDRLVEAAGEIKDARVEDLVEAQQYRRVDAPLEEIIDESFEVDDTAAFGAGLAAGVDREISVLTYTEVRRAPRIDEIVFCAILYSPTTFHGHRRLLLPSGCRRRRTRFTALQKRKRVC